MLLYWYACIFMNTDFYIIYDILGPDWWALSKTNSIMWIYLAIYEIIANEAFTVTDGLISWLFVVTFAYPTYVDSPYLELSSATYFVKKLVY